MPWIRARLTLVILAIVGNVMTPPDATASEIFEFRGVLHPTYGPVWDHQSRMDVIRWIAANGMNTYANATLDNPYQHVAWREPFPAWMLDQFDEEIRSAHELGVRWIPTMSPVIGLLEPVGPSRDICFSCDDDVDLLIQKYAWFHDRGVRHFLLRLDDGVKASSHAEDAIAFGEGDAAYGLMNAHLGNRLQERFPDATILMAPADFSGTTRTEYLAALSEQLDPRVVIMWTGGQIVSPRITGAEADAYRTAVSPDGGPPRRIVIKDHVASNDYSGSGVTPGSSPRTISWDYPGGGGVPLQLPVGPVKGRGADLVGRVDGLLLSAPVQAQVAKLPIATIAAFLSDPLAYTADHVTCPGRPWAPTQADCRAEEAWASGIARFAGDEAASVLHVADQMRATPTDRQDALAFAARRDEYLTALDGAFWQEARAALALELEAERVAGARIASGVPNEGFASQMSQHLDGLALQVQAGRLATDLLAAQRPELSIASWSSTAGLVTVAGTVRPPDPVRVASLETQLAGAHAAALAWPFVTHGDRVRTDLNGLWVNENRMDAYVLAAQERTAAWMPLSAVARLGPLTLTVGGVPVPIAPDGSFDATVARSSATSIAVVVTDATGRATGETRVA